MPDFDVAGIMPTVQKNALATQTQARAQQQKAQQMAVVTGQPTFWGRIGQVGIGQVNLLNAEKLVKSTAVKTARQGTAALGESVETAARILPGGQNDLKAQQQAVQSADKTTKNIQTLQKSGKITSSQATKLYKGAATNDNQTSQQAHATVEAGSEANQSKQGVGMLEATPRAVVNVGEEAVKQAKYLAGPDRTQQGQAGGNQIIKNQAAASKNPQYEKAIQSLKDKGVGTNAILTAQDMASKGAGSKQLTDYLTKQATGLNKQTNQGLSDMAQIVSVIAGGGQLTRAAIDKVTGKVASKELATNVGTNKLVQAGEKANARDTNIGKAAVGAKQVAETKVVNVGKKAITGRQITPETSETKLLGPGTGKITGKGFTASPSVDMAKVKTAARLNTINKKLNDVAQGKTSMSAEDAKALRTEKADIYKQAQTTKISDLGGDRTQNETNVSRGNSKPGFIPLKSAGDSRFPNSYKPDKLNNVLDDPALFDKYPGLKNVTVKYGDLNDMRSGTLATHNMKTDTITLPRQASDQEKLGMLLHETQHAVQKIEGRLSVGSSSHLLGRQEYSSNPIEVEARNAESRGRVVSELGGDRTQNETQIALEKAHNSGDTTAEGIAAAKLKDPALAGKNTTTRSAGKIFMDAQKSGKPITMDEARTQATKSSGREVSGSALRSEQEAVKAGLTKEFEDKATYKSGSYKDEAANAVKLAHDNPERAMDIAMGKKPGNNILHTSAVYHAVKNKAIAEGDTETMQKLVTSPRHTTVSQAAQRLGSEGYNATEDDPIAQMRQVSDARVAAVEKKLGSSVPKAVNDTAKEIASHEKSPSKFEWQSFVESIKC